VIVDLDEIEVGRWALHVFAARHRSDVSVAHFSIVVEGAITDDNQSFGFSPASHYATDCGNGTYDLTNFTCSCPVDRLGQSCQTVVDVHQGLGSRIEFKLPPLGLKWLSFDGPGFARNYRLRTEEVVGLFRLYAVLGNPLGIPAAYEAVRYMDYLAPAIVLQQFTGTLFGRGNVSFLIRNRSV
jgi:hypothetical protein